MMNVHQFDENISLSTLISRLARGQQGREHFIEQIALLSLSPSPAFLYVHDPWTYDLTCSLLRSIGTDLSQTSIPDVHVKHAFVDCIESFTPKILFDTVMNSLANVKPTWENGSHVWNGGPHAWSDSFDGFLHALRIVHSELAIDEVGSNKSRSKECAGGKKAVKFVLVFERAERLRDTLPDFIVPLSRLGELTQIDITTIFSSTLAWEDVCSSKGFLAEPFRVVVERPAKQDTIAILSSKFPDTPPSDPIDPYNPRLLPLFTHFVETVYDVCSPFTSDPQELAYIIAARWPGFVSPVLEDWKAQDANDDDECEIYQLPSEDARIRLTRFFSSSLTNALEMLYPRLMTANEWCTVNRPAEGLRMSQLSRQQQHMPAASEMDHAKAPDLPRMSVFILVAAFLASFNPPKSDVRMFARSENGKRQRKKGGGTRKGKAGTAIKIPQRLLGPMAFPLDRLIAILGSLLEEYDIDMRPARPHLDHPIDTTEVEVNRVQVLSSITELVSMRLMQRTTPMERIDGPPMFRSAISYDVALQLARRVDVPLNDLMWEPY